MPDLDTTTQYLPEEHGHDRKCGFCRERVRHTVKEHNRSIVHGERISTVFNRPHTFTYQE